MGSNVYFPVLWLVIATLVIGIFAATSAMSYFRLVMAENAVVGGQSRRQLSYLKQLHWLLWAIAGTMCAGGVAAWYQEKSANDKDILVKRTQLMPVFDKNNMWEAPDPYLAETDKQAKLIAYGRDIIARTHLRIGASNSEVVVAEWFATRI